MMPQINNWKLFPLFFSGLIVVFPISIAFAEKLSLEAFLTGLQTEHPFIAAETARQEIADFERARELASQDWNLSAAIDYNYLEPAELGISAAKSRANLGGEAELSKKIWDTGGRVSGRYFDSFENTRARDSGNIGSSEAGGFSSSQFFVEDFYKKGFVLSYNQPLLKNRGGSLDRLAWELKGFDSELAEVRSQENIEKFLLDSALLYIQWAELDAKRSILKKRVKLSKRQLDQTRRMTEAGLKENEDLFRAEESYWASRQNLALTEANWQGLREQIAALLGKGEPVNLKVAYDLQQLHKVPSSNEVQALLEKSSRLLNILGLEKNRTLAEAEGTEGQDAHQLDLELSAGLTSGKEKFDDQPDLDKPEAAVGLRYTRALGSSANKADLSRAEARARQIELQYQSQLLDLSASTRALLRRLQMLEKVIAANKQQLNSAIKRTRSEEEAYQQGRGELNFVIQSQDSEQSARFQLFETGALYNSLYLQFKELTDSLLVNFSSRSSSWVDNK